mmetsp:Transcript_108361/g.305555  ORF Transcript_108361/g.305555 Transcript_108361/m.305555 type:complete len:230 (+) Transcript_108361:163-852(+)
MSSMPAWLGGENAMPLRSFSFSRGRRNNISSSAKSSDAETQRWTGGGYEGGGGAANGEPELSLSRDLLGRGLFAGLGEHSQRSTSARSSEHDACNACIAHRGAAVAPQLRRSPRSGDAQASQVVLLGVLGQSSTGLSPRRCALLHGRSMDAAKALLPDNAAMPRRTCGEAATSAIDGRVAAHFESIIERRCRVSLPYKAGTGFGSSVQMRTASAAMLWAWKGTSSANTS